MLKIICPRCRSDDIRIQTSYYLEDFVCNGCGCVFGSVPIIAVFPSEASPPFKELEEAVANCHQKQKEFLRFLRRLQWVDV